ncbi:VOC family protein [Pilimelia anulata]|uniref:VOC family protein n=1 Tax=Pilimelia anulata TaxID=53371 RepID=UPI001E5B70DE|nr:VOC family protein [Pilimelia anulata]
MRHGGAGGREATIAVQFNHTIVHATDRRVSAEFLAHILDLTVGAPFGPFLPVDTANGVTLDYATVPAGTDIVIQHYAFLVSEPEFDAAFDRIRAAGIAYFADPHERQPGEINHLYGGRGVYFRDPDGHGMEIITQPYRR